MFTVSVSASGIAALAEEFLDPDESTSSLNYRLRELLRVLRNQATSISEREGEHLLVEGRRDGSVWAYTITGRDSGQSYTTLLVRHVPQANKTLRRFGDLLAYALNSREGAPPRLRDQFNTATRTRDWACECCGERYLNERELIRHESRRHDWSQL